MRFVDNRAEELKIAYIGGGSRGWAWGLMSDLAAVEDMCGTVALYDINKDAAKRNAHIGNKIKELEGCKSAWNYTSEDSIGQALEGADFVVISILPGTFDEMQSDVHAPEEYGILQSVGDTAGPGGLVRALRSIPMFEEIAKAVKQYCPKAWVINYTNPMTVCVQALYRIFPEIKAFGCCHEVFGTQKLLAEMLRDQLGTEHVARDDIKVNVLGLNHFTWVTEAQYRNMDLIPLYRKFAETYRDTGFHSKAEDNWLNKYFTSGDRVKFDLFLRYGTIAAAGDRHLAEFCPGNWYLKDRESVKKWQFELTPVSWRKQDLQERLQRSERLFTGEETFKLKETGEEGVQQMRALLGLRDLVTNVNIPNAGQIPNLPLGAVVETNAHFRANAVKPVFAGAVPNNLYALVSRVCGEQAMIVEAALSRNLDMAFEAFANDPNVCLPREDAKRLFGSMIENTKTYLPMYY